MMMSCFEHRTLYPKHLIFSNQPKGSGNHNATVGIRSRHGQFHFINNYSASPFGFRGRADFGRERSYSNASTLESFLALPLHVTSTARSSYDAATSCVRGRLACVPVCFDESPSVSSCDRL